MSRPRRSENSRHVLKNRVEKSSRVTNADANPLLRDGKFPPHVGLSLTAYEKNATAACTTQRTDQHTTASSAFRRLVARLLVNSRSSLKVPRGKNYRDGIRILRDVGCFSVQGQFYRGSFFFRHARVRQRVRGFDTSHEMASPCDFSYAVGVIYVGSKCLLRRGWIPGHRTLCTRRSHLCWTLLGCTG